MTTTNSIDRERVNRLHRSALVVDTHIDTTQRLLEPEWNPMDRHDFGHVDVPRMREGGVDAVFLAVFASGPLPPGRGPTAAREQIAAIKKTVEMHNEHIALAHTAGDIRQAKKQGQVAFLIAIEGGYLIDDSLDILREYHRAGATYMTLTHCFHTTWCDSAGVHEDLEPRHGGLTDFGREVVREMNRLGMMVDVSHVSDDAFWQVVELSTAPLIATHSSCRAVSPHRRNLTDDMMRAIAKGGGVVQINFAAGFIDPNFPPLDPEAVHAFFEAGGTSDRPLTDYVSPLRWLVDHVDHALQLIGPDHVGLGSDFDGVPALPQDMEDCSKLPNLTAALLERGHSENDLTKVLGENALRVMEACQQVGVAGRTS